MFSSNLHSHPDKKLIVHLKNVAEKCVLIFKINSLNLVNFYSENEWDYLMYIYGFSHDLGKATSYFQDCLFEKDIKEKIRMKNRHVTNHSLFSAVICHFLISEFLENHTHIKNSDFASILPFLFFLSIKKHHGNLKNAVPVNDEQDELNCDYEHLQTQLDAIDVNELEFLFNHLNLKLDNIFDFNKIKQLNINTYFEKKIQRHYKRLWRKLDKKLDYYFFYQFIYSILLYSDKNDVVFNKKNSNGFCKTINENIVSDYKNDKFGKAITDFNILREQIFQEAEESILKVPFTQKILTLNVPTGSGKTLTAFNAALKLRNRLSNEKGINPTIIYVLPFTSIIDQNFDVIEDILKIHGLNSSDKIIKHHHLSDFTYKTENDEFTPNEAIFSIESWDSEIVITTFYQLFHTILSNRNRMIQKFHKICNSIILLDEVQTIPYKYWKLVRECFLSITNLFNTYLFFITATQPKIFNNESSFELIPDKKQYFQKIDRVNIKFNENEITLSEFKSICEKEVTNSNESFLIVMNTINTATELFTSLKKIHLDCEYYYLATNIIPKERLLRILEIKKSKKRKIIVSTQLIEAGVDIDIENVWRDFAPLDSINQVCGRCNRNNSPQKGNVQIFNIVNENHHNTPYANYIYGKSVLGLVETKNIIGCKDKISEKVFLNNIENYYSLVDKKLRTDESDEILHFIENLQFLDISKTFKLIDEQNYEKKDLFIEIDEKAEEIWQQYCLIKEIDNKIERKEAFIKIKRIFYEYVITIPLKFLPSIYNEDDFIIYIKISDVKKYYNYDTGWMRKEYENELLLF